jgi:2',3'-cyclic-nucleotide 2'-phosphodiesterase (5'-nucleotidase family)
MANKTSLTILQLNDSHAYFDLHQELFWQGNQAVYRPSGGYSRIATIVKQVRAENPGAFSFVIAEIPFMEPIRTWIRMERH